MAFDPKPSTWLGAGYSLGTHTIILQTADASTNKTLPQLTDAQANATTGNIRNVAFALLEALYQAWVAQAGSQPTKMTVSRNSITQSDGSLSYSYSVNFNITPPTGAYALASE